MLHATFRKRRQAVEIYVPEGIIADEGVEVWAVVEAVGVGAEPAAEVGDVEAHAEVDEAGLGIVALAHEAPGGEGGAAGGAEGIVGLGFEAVAGGIEERTDAAVVVMQGDVDS